MPREIAHYTLVHKGEVKDMFSSDAEDDVDRLLELLRNAMAYRDYPANVIGDFELRMETANGRPIRPPFRGVKAD